MPKSRVLFLTAATVAVIAASLADNGGGASSQIVDRTVVCTPVAVSGALRDLNVEVSPPFRNDFTNQPANISVSSGPQTEGFRLVFVQARGQKPFGNWLLTAGVYVNSRRCSMSRASVPVSPKGLAGPPIRWSKVVECAVRGRVVVRVRALLEAPAPWRKADEWYDGAKKNVVEARVAVRSQSTGRPIAFTEFDPKGRTQLWFSPLCR